MQINICDNLLNVCVRVFYKRSHSYVLFYEVQLQNRLKKKKKQIIIIIITSYLNIVRFVKTIIVLYSYYFISRLILLMLRLYIVYMTKKYPKKKNQILILNQLFNIQ